MHKTYAASNLSSAEEQDARARAIVGVVARVLHYSTGNWKFDWEGL